MARITGIGGIFLKARDPKALSAWYAQHLGVQLTDWGGAILLWSDEIPAGTGQTTWMLFPEATKPCSTTASTISPPCSPSSKPPAFPSTPTANLTPTATSPGSPTQKAIVSNSGNPSRTNPQNSPGSETLNGRPQHRTSSPLPHGRRH
jgi:hypothetical protein